ncbi:hypothetical protein F5Y06DRAFT_188415 [Hypoxylon sp. FL0890]|nr:hypothetical protein F5Y06DRAFT_188415 [Hypoxylon sp. FL0890]
MQTSPQIYDGNSLQEDYLDEELQPYGICLIARRAARALGLEIQPLKHTTLAAFLPAASDKTASFPDLEAGQARPSSICLELSLDENITDGPSSPGSICLNEVLNSQHEMKRVSQSFSEKIVCSSGPSYNHLSERLHGLVDDNYGPYNHCSSAEGTVHDTLSRQQPDHVRIQVGTHKATASRKGPRRFRAPTEALLMVVAVMSARAMYLFDHHRNQSNTKYPGRFASDNTGDPVELPFTRESQSSSNLRGILARIQQPSPTTFFSAIVVFCAVIGLQYYRSMGSRYHDVFLVCGMTIGMIAGLASHLKLEGIIFRLLPGANIATLLIHSYASRFGLL